MNIKEYLTKENMSQRELAKSIGVSDPYVSEIIAGKKNPSPALATRIEKATNGEVKASDLLQHLVPDGYRLVKEEKEAA